MSALCLVSCYEDKGNYDYNPIPEIQLSGMEKEYTVYAMIDNLDIVPEFEGKEDYNCTWTLFLLGKPQAKVDTLSTEPDLHHKVVEASGLYTLALTIENRKTGDRQIFSSTVTIHTTYSAGCYILKEIDGETDVDLITTKHELARDILEGREARLEGSPRSFVICPDINYVDEDGEPHERVKTAWIASDKNVRMLTLENMTPIYDIHTMFYDEQPNESPINMRYASNALDYFSNSGCYDMYTLIPTAMHKFGLPLRLTGASGDEAKSYTCSQHIISGRMYHIFYDDLNQRFLICSNGSLYHFTEKNQYGYPAKYSPNNMNSDLIYLCKTQSNGYALMFDKNLQKHVVYKLETSAFDRYGNEMFSPLLDRIEVPTNVQVAQGETFGCNLWNPFIYYSIGHQLCMFDYNSKSETKDILPGLEGNITMIKHIQGTDPTTSQRYEYLVVGTTQNGHYKLYFCEMLAGKPDLSKTPKVVEGDGAPKDIYIL